MLDLLAHGADGHGPVHLRLSSATEIGLLGRWATRVLWMLSVQQFEGGHPDFLPLVPCAYTDDFAVAASSFGLLMKPPFLLSWCRYSCVVKW